MELEITRETQERNLLETVAWIAIDVFDKSDPISYESGEIGRSNYERFCARYPENETGFIERIDVCIEWAQEFEKINHNRFWDGEWYEELSAFVDEKLWACWGYGFRGAYKLHSNEQPQITIITKI